MRNYKTTGICSTEITYEIEDGVLTHCEFHGGKRCKGNTQAVQNLAVGLHVNEVIRRLKGIQCMNGTSCPDQLAQALECE